MSKPYPVPYRPVMRPEAFYGISGSFVEAIETDTEASHPAILIQLLVAFGNATGRGPYFPINADRHYMNEFVVIVGSTATSRKGTSWSLVRDVFERAEHQWTSDSVRGGLASG